MKTFLIICCALLIAYGTSTPQKHIGTDGREYLIETDYKYNWFEASHECARRNRQLLTIDSAEKQDVINKLFKGEKSVHLWLGANDEFKSTANAERPFFWLATGKKFTYFNWHDHHPLKVEGNQHCVLIWTPNKKWIDWRCNNDVGFICEEKQLMESSNKNVSDAVQQFIKNFDLKFLSLLKDNMAQLNEQLENIQQVSNDTKYEVNKLTNITQTAVEKILYKNELSTKELNHEITKQANDLNDQLQRTADEMNAKFSEKQNFTYHAKNVVLIQ